MRELVLCALFHLANISTFDLIVRAILIFKLPSNVIRVRSSFALNCSRHFLSQSTADEKPRPIGYRLKTFYRDLDLRALAFTFNCIKSVLYDWPVSLF